MASATRCQLVLVAFLLVNVTLARRRALNPSVSAQVHHDASHKIIHQGVELQRVPRTPTINQRGYIHGIAFVQRSAIIKGDIHPATNGGDISGERSDDSVHRLHSVLSIRGGASSDNNGMQSIIQVLPSPIIKFIEMLCRFIESLTGFELLPRVEETKKKRKSKSKKQIVEKEVSVKKANVKRRKRSISDDEEDVPTKASAKRRKRKSTSTQKANSEEEDEPNQKETTTVSTSKKTKSKRPDIASQTFLANDLKSSNPNYRIQRELKQFLKSPPPGLSVKISGKNVRLWVITLCMPKNTIYAGGTYKLRVQFPADYPTSPPSVYFLNPTPRHEHVYTNGDICLSLLGKDWRPIMTAQSIAQAIMSILCGAQRKSLPMDNAAHAGNKPGQKQDEWVYHDDNC